MPEYFTLFNAVTDAIAQLEKAVAALKQAQLDAEEAYIRRGSNSPRPLFCVHALDQRTQLRVLLVRDAPHGENTSHFCCASSRVL